MRLLPRRRRPKKTVSAVERTYRHIWHYLAVGSDRRYPLNRRNPNAVVLQMGKVASTSIQSALWSRGINAFHSHGLSAAPQFGMLTRLLENEPTFRLAAHDLRRHIQSVALRMLVRWYRTHKAYRGHRLKIITLTRDPVTHYRSAFLHRREGAQPAIFRWYRARMGLDAAAPVDEAQAITALVAEVASIIVEGRSPEGSAALGRCAALARQRWPDHPVIAAETSSWLTPLSWFDREITPLFGLDMLASPGFAERGWAEQSNDWVDVMVLQYERLSSLVPEIQRFFGLAELVLPRENLTTGRAGAAEIGNAVESLMATPVGQACARELRASSYGRACGYDRLT